MKKLLIFALIVLMLGSCSTYYGKYDYDRYFQNNEPYVTVDSEEEAAEFIARKLARRFKRARRQTLSVLAFTDEYGDRINRGDFFARMVVAEMTRYNNPIVVERESLYELVKERELSMTNLIDNEGYELRQLLQADFILHGRILRGKHEDMISVRCFEVGTGEVVYAATVSIDYTPEPTYTTPVYDPTPNHPVIIVNNPPSNPNPPTVIIDNDNDNDKEEPKKEPNKKPSDGTENKGKIKLSDQKSKPSDQYQYKEKEDTYTEPVKKPSVTVKKSIPDNVKPTPVIKKSTKVKKSTPEPVNKDPLEEEKNEKSKKSSKTSNKKKTSIIKK